jgi:hypothetical protein
MVFGLSMQPRKRSYSKSKMREPAGRRFSSYFSWPSRVGWNGEKEVCLTIT